METPTTTKIRLAATKDEVLAAIREALPEDAIVRNEDDGVGRFASERTVMIIGAGGDRLMLYRGNWRLVKAREENPQLDVKLKEKDSGISVRLKSGAEEKPTTSSLLMGVLTNSATVALVVVAYHMFRDLPIDRNQVAAIGVGGGIAWSVVARLWPSKPAGTDLLTMVRDALKALDKPDD